MYQASILQQQMYKGLDAVVNAHDSSKDLFDTVSYKLYSACMTINSELSDVVDKIPQPIGDMGGYLDGPKGLIPLFVAGVGMATIAVFDEDKIHTIKDAHRKNRNSYEIDYFNTWKKPVIGMIGAGLAVWQSARFSIYSLSHELPNLSDQVNMIINHFIK